MEKVHVNLGPRSYDIEIGSGNLADAAKFCDVEQDDAHAVIITDTNVDELYTRGVDEVARRVFSDTLETPIVRHALGDSAGVIGAALVGV